MTRIAINGLGRIGRAALKILLNEPDVTVVAINDLYPAYQLAYLINFDSIYGKYENKIYNDDQNLYVNGRQIHVLNTPNINQLPWKNLDVDIVLECTGKHTKKEDLEMHLQAGAKHVILSAPSKSEDVPTVVYGVNQLENEQEQKIISTASCTTNAITPVVEIMGRRIGIRKAIMTTLHAYTSSQSIVDKPSADLRKGRAAGENFVPTTTGAATSTTRVLPEYKNKFQGISVRGPVPVGSIADITFITERTTSVEEINNIFTDEAGGERYMGVVGVNTDPIVSSDIIKDPRASIVDLTLTKVVDGDLVKIMTWYDNEWGYANQMVKEVKRISRLEMAVY